MGNKWKAWIAAGSVLIAAALAIVLFNICTAQTAKQSSERTLAELDAQMIRIREIQRPAAPVAEDDADTPVPEMPTVRIGSRDYIGKLTIPALELELPVQSGWDYTALTITPCRYEGSVYDGSLIICAHNYPAHFGRLKTLKAGDAVSFEDADGTVYDYTVTAIEILNPEDTGDMTACNPGLTLFTCTVGGRTRLTVRCA